MFSFLSTLTSLVTIGGWIVLWSHNPEETKVQVKRLSLCDAKRNNKYLKEMVPCRLRRTDLPLLNDCRKSFLNTISLRVNTAQYALSIQYWETNPLQDSAHFLRTVEYDAQLKYWSAQHRDLLVVQYIYPNSSKNPQGMQHSRRENWS